MPLVVTLDVFSGRPNPVWTVPDEDARQFDDRLRALTDVTNLKAAGLGQLGYRGFSVANDAGVMRARVFGGSVDLGDDTPTLVAGDREIEQWLLSTAPDEVMSTEVRAHVQASITEPDGLALLRRPMAQAVGCPVCQAADAPPYTPAMWNTPAVQPFNNCYNYANNQITNAMAQPGRATGRPMTGMSCPGGQPSAVSDGLSSSPNFVMPRAPGQGWYVALVIWPGNDFIGIARTASAAGRIDPARRRPGTSTTRVTRFPIPRRAIGGTTRRSAPTW